MNGIPHSDPSLETIETFLLSLGIGLLMGLERERNPASRAGLRTFSLVALLGTVCGLLATRTGSSWLLAAGIFVVGAMMISAYHRQPDPDDPGTTSVIALLLAFCYGAMVWYGYRTSAVMLGILTTILLYFKAELQSISKQLTRRDITSVLQFCVLSLVILPILPNQNYGPYDTLNPYQVWWMVVLVSGVSLAGYAALRIVGQRHGALLLGVLGGMASSTATTLVYSRHARATESLQPLCLVVILTANLIVLCRLGIVAAILQPTILPTLLPTLGVGLLAGIAFVAFAWRRMAGGGELPQLDLRNPTELATALTFGAVYAGVLLLSAALTDKAGNLGLYAVALVSGLTDVDAITLSSLRLFGQEKLLAGEATTAILLAMLANLTFKFGIVVSVAGGGLARRLLGGFAAVAIACVGGWLLTG